MDAPGFSIFQSNEIIPINKNMQKLEDEEALNDQIRRNEEVKNQLQTAFDDLSDDNDDTVESRSNNCNKSNIENNIYFHENMKLLSPTKNRENYSPTSRTFINRINHIDSQPSQVEEIDSKVKIRHIISPQMKDKKKCENKINQLQQRLAVAEADSERCRMARQQSHELLIESKTKISEQDETIKSYKTKLEALEMKNEELMKKLQHQNTILSDTELKYQMIEKNVGLHSDRHMEYRLKQTNDRHLAQVDMMQHQIDGLHKNIDDKDKELQMVKHNFKDLQRSMDNVLVEKSKTINDLSKAIEDSQKQCHKLMANGDLCHENIQLKNIVSESNREIEDMRITIENLMKRVNANRLFEIGVDTLKSSEVNPQNTAQSSNTTEIKKSSFCNSFEKEVDKQIKQLEEQLMAKDEEIKTLKNEENNALVQMMNFKKESSRLTNKLSVLQNQIDKVNEFFDENVKLEKCGENLLPEDSINVTDKYDVFKKHYYNVLEENKNLKKNNNNKEVPSSVDSGSQCEPRNDLESLNSQINHLDFLLQDSQREVQRLNNLVMNLTGSKNELSRRPFDDYQSSKNKKSHVKENVTCESEKMNVNVALPVNEINHKGTFHEVRKDVCEINKEHAEYLKIEAENIQLKDSCNKYMTKISHLETAVGELNFTIKELEQKMFIKDNNSKLIEELREKAKEFDDFISNQQSLKTALNVERMKDIDHAPSLEIESKMAKIMAYRIQMIEKTFKEKMDALNKSVNNLNIELEDKRSSLDDKEIQIEILKNAILLERDKMKEIFDNRDIQAKSIFEKQCLLSGKYHFDLQTALENVRNLRKEISSCNKEFENERQNMAELLNQCNEEKNTSRIKETGLRNELHLMKIENHKIITHWAEKYKSAKKTAGNYKKYAEDKDKHIERESERIKVAYTAALKKMRKKYSKFSTNS